MTDPIRNGSVLGITDFGPVGGTPLIPPSYLTLYFLITLLVLAVLYIYFYRKKRPILWRYRLKLLFALTIGINFVAALGTVLLAAYWLIPSPGIRRTTPVKDEQSFATVNRIEIVFDRPIDRNDLEKSIFPEVPGQWEFENSIYTTHLYRKLVFYPLYSLRPDTNYTVKLSNIRNLAKVSNPYDYEFNFKTQSTPLIAAVAPFNREENVKVDSEVNVVLDKDNNNVSEYYFEFEPQINFDLKLNSDKRVYNLKPRELLKQGTEYKLRIKKSDVIINLQDESVVERGAETQVYEKTFTTKYAPGYKSFRPEFSNALSDSDIEIEFSKDMNKESVEENFSIEPTIVGVISWEGNSKLKFNPVTLPFNTEYEVIIKKGTKARDGSFLEEDAVKSFKTIGPVKVSGINPENGWKGVNLKSAIKVTFDQEVDHDSAQSKFSINPEVKGNFSWDGDTLIYTPEGSLLATSTYKITVAKGIESIKGQDSEEEFKSEFTTQFGTIKINAPAYYQKYSLSCEFASLRIALAAKGANVSEDELISKVGFDKTPHSGNIWGNPYNAFVGNINGRQMVDGYGVYWGPIAKAARSYRDAQEFQGWSIEQLNKEIANGNPVVIWVYAGRGTKTSWNTPDGQYIYAVRDEHAVTAIGFVGEPGNPSQMIINDPLKGQVYWSRATFDSKWGIFGRSGVVVR